MFIAAMSTIAKLDKEDVCLFFKDFIYLFIRNREREKERGRNTGRGRSRLHAGSRMRDLIPGLQDHVLAPNH